MKSLSIALAVVIAFAPWAASAQRARVSRPASAPGGGASRPAPSQPSRGFNLGNDVPASTARGNNGSAVYNKNTGNAAAYNKNTGTATTYNKNTNTATQYQKNTTNSTTYNRNSGAYNGNNSAGGYNKNTGNAAVYNKNTGNMTVYNKNNGTSSTYHYNNTGRNGYYYSGRVVVNPRYVGPAWGWNRGVVWVPAAGYWGGGFWGPFAVGAVAAMGYVNYANQRYTSYSVSPASPGANLLSNYGLQQVPCGPPGLVVIYGPNFGVICANPNGLIAAGNYAVNVDNLTLQSQ